MEFYPGFEQDNKRKYTKQVNKVNAQLVKQTLQQGLDESQRLWDAREVSHAYIVGYLQGVIKDAISDLE